MSQGVWAQIALNSRLTLPQPISSARTAGADLSGQTLQGAHFDGIDLRGACLDRANLHDAQLRAARLDGASLQGTLLGRARLQGATLQGARAIEADLRGADLRDVVATGFVAERCDLRGARWNARWPQAPFTDCTTTDGLHPGLSDVPSDLVGVPAQARPPWRCAALSPCGRFMAIGGAERTLSLHDAATLSPRWCVRVQEGVVVQLCFDVEGSHVVALLERGEIRLWPALESTPDGRVRASFPGSLTSAEDICELRFDPVRQAPASLSRRGVEWYLTEWGGRMREWLQLHARSPCRWTGAAFAGPPALLVVTSEHGAGIIDPQGLP